MMFVERFVNGLVETEHFCIRDTVIAYLKIKGLIIYKRSDNLTYCRY